MSHHHVPRVEDTKITMDGLGSKVFMISALIGVVGLAVTFGLGLSQGDDLKHFAFAYLTNYAFFLSISLGALIFMPIMYLTRASWNVVLRRLAEVTAAVMPLLAILAIPVIVFAGKVYGWTDPAVAASHAMTHKAAYLSQGAFTIRWVIYFAIWSGYSLFFWRTSVSQDKSGDLKYTKRLENFSGFAILACALSIAGASFDLLMSVDPLWFSTMFGVYYWSGGFVTFFAVLTLALLGLQNTGRMQGIVSPEHFHDLGKLMFAFTFFWGYIAFSQFMLYWYANIPEETSWYLVRTREGWDYIAYATLFATLLIPFLGLVSRFAKRSRKLLAFWAVWIIAAQWLNLYWVVIPEFSETLIFSPMYVTCFIGIGGLWFAGITKLASSTSLVPTGDPRLDESLRFENA
ncbi:MAG: quinol:cytochrome C oxidoreductase [Candidatus Krumholzibacteria bacterium]|nr:quinol:cytochrome C oxidoreductase [Candidatus Krumholzibacteria bacterium]